VLVTGRFPEGYSRIYGFPGKFERQEANLGDKGIGVVRKSRSYLQAALVDWLLLILLITEVVTNEQKVQQ
jgi:hypothetical protein